MKRTLIFTFVLVLVFAMTGCSASEAYMGFAKSDFTVLSESDSHGGFHGDGVYALALDCSENKEAALDILQDWPSLPLSENLQLILYGGEKNGVSYEYDLAEQAGIPEIKNGYYCFTDRNSKSTDAKDDTELFSRSSYNFSLALYDSDTDRLYYLEFDT